MKRTCGLFFLCAAMTIGLTACGNGNMRQDGDGTLTGSDRDSVTGSDTRNNGVNDGVTDYNAYNGVTDSDAYNGVTDDRSVTDRAGNVMDNAGDAIRDAADDAGDAVRNGVHDAQNAADRIEERARQALQGTGDVPDAQNNG